MGKLRSHQEWKNSPTIMKAFICTQHGMAFAGSCLTISEE